MARNVPKHRYHERGRLSEDNMEGRVRRRKGKGMHTLTPVDVWEHAEHPWPCLLHLKGSEHCSCGAENDNKEVEEPLLGYAADITSTSDSHDQSRREQGGSRHEGSQALVLHSINRVDWEELWRVLWGNCRDSLVGILGEGQKIIGFCQALKGTGKWGESMRKSCCLPLVYLIALHHNVH